MTVWPAERFPEAARETVGVLWEWHRAAMRARPSGRDAARVRAGEPAECLPAMLWQRARAACLRHGLDPARLADVLEGRHLVLTGQAPESGADLERCLDLLAGSHAEMLASLAGYSASWQKRGAASFGHALLLLDNLTRLPEQAREDAVLIVGKDLTQAGLSVEDLKSGSMPDGFGRVAWKHSIRIRDALAGARTLIVEMNLRDRLYTKRLWLSALESVIALERMEFDVWRGFTGLGPASRARILIQSIFGRTAFRNA